MLIRFHHAYHYYLVVRLRPLWIRLVNYAVDRKTGRAFFNAEKKLFGNALLNTKISLWSTSNKYISKMKPVSSEKRQLLT